MISRERTVRTVMDTVSKGTQSNLNRSLRDLRSLLSHYYIDAKQWLKGTERVETLFLKGKWHARPRQGSVARTS